MNHHPNNNGHKAGNTDTTFTNTNTAVFTEAYCYGPRTVIIIIPHIGKTHQLRVAAKSMGIPLMGDPLYEPKMISNVEHTTINENDDDRTSLTTTNNETIHQQQPQPQYPVHRTMLHATGIYIPSCDVVDTPITVWSDPPFFDDDNNNEKILFHCQMQTKYQANQESTMDLR
ncbi:pseudouridine synthase Rlu family protein [Nitzschia inconspicua]|uniref:Pseudouridine synthase Rlu family protein n=1 Tax=Nitzschia inconspicua TaxID=303405 RepID=A0A9K3L959_9STRA|nr:pseudouridine synthase Rlu family protein [Nitzschia inconspicua]